jgi:hypothetical protein
MGAFCGLVVGSLLSAALPASADEAAGKQLRFLVAALDRRIDWLDTGRDPNAQTFEQLAKLASLPGYEKDPSKKVRIECDLDSFDWAVAHIDNDDSGKWRNMRLETALGIVGQRLPHGGVILLRDDFIEIVPRIAAEDEVGLRLEPEEPMPVLVNRFITNTPLDKALQQIAVRYNQNIVIAPFAEAKSAMPITARLINAPIDAAVETLTCMADLRMVRQANVLYVTTKEQADEIQPVKWKKPWKPRAR